MVSGFLGHLHGGGGGHAWRMGVEETLGEKEEYDRRQKMGEEINA